MNLYQLHPVFRNLILLTSQKHLHNLADTKTMNSQKFSLNLALLVAVVSGVTSTFYVPSPFEHYIKPGNGWIGWTAPYQYRPKIDAVSFYQNRYCQGSEYGVEIGQGECQTLPKEVCDWNLSLKTYGSCIEVFENEFCSGAPTFYQRKRGLVTSKVFRTNTCSSTKLNGFDVVRSFRRSAC